MFKWLSTIISLCFFSFNTAQAKPFVFACEPEWQALAQEIGRDQIKAVSATHGRQDPHFIRVKPSLMSRIKRADLLICSGADLEVGWLPLLLRNGTKKIQAGQLGHILVSDYVTNIEIPQILDRSLGDIHPEGNPHVHLDPKIILKTAAIINERLALIDPDHKENYAANLKEFETKWLTATERWESARKSLAGKSVVVQHKSFSYLLQFLGINVLTSIEEKPGIPPSARHLAKVVSTIKQNSTLAIIRSPFDTEAPSDWVAEKTGVRIITLPYTVGGLPETTDLYKVYDQSIELLSN